MHLSVHLRGQSNAKLFELLFQVEEVVEEAIGPWTAVSIEDLDTECRAAMQNTEPEKEEAD